ncbi:hypothetical protein [Aurantiacibacter zhengii]|nr:hypothetical protein [Aurantiacibacter zhengii]
MRATTLLGDEFTYTDMARSIANGLTGQSSITAMIDAVIGPGWFMPAMGIAGAPAFLFSDEPPFWVLRLLPLIFNLALLALLLKAVWLEWGRVHAAALLLFPGMVLGWYVAASGWWPEIPSGLLAMLSLVGCCKIGMHVVRGEPVGWRLLLLFEVALIAALYFRGPVLVLAIGLHAILFVLVLTKLPASGRSLGRLAVGIALFIALLLPWSIAISAKFEKPIPTTTNVPLVLANSFGGPERSCFGPCEPGQDIWPAWEFSQAVTEETGENVLDIQAKMLDHALADLTTSEYLASVRENFGRFLFDPMQRLRAYKDRMYSVPENLREPLIGLISAVTLIVYVPFLLALLLANILPFRHGDKLRMQSILLKAATTCAFIQPFVHKSSARYWTGFAPLMAWAAALLMSAWLQRRAGKTVSTMPGWIDWAQRGYGVVFFACGVLITVGLSA